MKLIFTIISVVFALFLVVFYVNRDNSLNNNTDKMLVEKQDLKEAYFAWGCFWCIEAIMQTQDGVTEAISGYIWFDHTEANYENVSSWNTKYRESVKVVFDSNVVSYKELVEVFMTQIDPTDEWWQFADRGYQYTTAIYYTDEDQKKIAEEVIEKLEASGKFDSKIVTKIEKMSNFYEAEEYHQDYFLKSSLKYKTYKIWSGRSGYISNNKQKYEDIFKGDDSSSYIDYSEEAIKNTDKKFIVLFFHADWCPTCKAFEKQVLSESVPDDILILKVDFDTENDLRKKYNILTQTSFVLINKDGNLIKRWVWAKWIDDIVEKLKDVDLESWETKTYTDEELRARLTPMQYKVAVEWWTEPAFNNEYWDYHEEWIYVDVIDWTALFSSTDKFDSGTGWPSFTKPIDDNFIQEEDDYKLLVKRTEVKSSSSHLGHVFDDWPEETWWQRYCINSAALRFVAKQDLEKEWYWKYLELFN